jgi:hypothetical protein
MSGTGYIDRKPRAVVQVKSPDMFKPEITIPNDFGFVLDQAITVTIQAEQEDPELVDAMNNHGQE